jgi:hypothetical protein
MKKYPRWSAETNTIAADFSQSVLSTASGARVERVAPCDAALNVCSFGVATAGFSDALSEMNSAAQLS